MNHIYNHVKSIDTVYNLEKYFQDYSTACANPQPQPIIINLSYNFLRKNYRFNNKLTIKMESKTRNAKKGKTSRHISAKQKSTLY